MKYFGSEKIKKVCYVFEINLINPKLFHLKSKLEYKIRKLKKNILNPDLMKLMAYQDKLVRITKLVEDQQNYLFFCMMQKQTQENSDEILLRESLNSKNKNNSESLSFLSEEKVKTPNSLILKKLYKEFSKISKFSPSINKLFKISILDCINLTLNLHRFSCDVFKFVDKSTYSYLKNISDSELFKKLEIRINNKLIPKNKTKKLKIESHETLSTRLENISDNEDPKCDVYFSVSINESIFKSSDQNLAESQNRNISDTHIKNKFNCFKKEKSSNANKVFLSQKNLYDSRNKCRSLKETNKKKLNEYFEEDSFSEIKSEYSMNSSKMKIEKSLFYRNLSKKGISGYSSHLNSFSTNVRMHENFDAGDQKCKINKKDTNCSKCNARNESA
jgi:hypothetical protein